MPDDTPGKHIRSRRSAQPSSLWFVLACAGILTAVLFGSVAYYQHEQLQEYRSAEPLGRAFRDYVLRTAAPANDKTEDASTEVKKSTPEERKRAFDCAIDVLDVADRYQDEGVLAFATILVMNQADSEKGFSEIPGAAEKVRSKLPIVRKLLKSEDPGSRNIGVFFLLCPFAGFT